jgi:hypothetical protein
MSLYGIDEKVSRGVKGLSLRLGTSISSLGSWKQKQKQTITGIETRRLKEELWLGRRARTGLWPRGINPKEK